MPWIFEAKTLLEPLTFSGWGKIALRQRIGFRQRIAHNDRDLSLRRFRELICPCMTQAEQRDTADEIVAEFKLCLLTWNICMRKKDSNVRASIARCQLTDYQKHKKGSIQPTCMVPLFGHDSILPS